jgi:hypothetical protein
MRSFTEGTGFELSHIVDNFPQAELVNGTDVLQPPWSYPGFGQCARYPKFIAHMLSGVVEKHSGIVDETAMCSSERIGQSGKYCGRMRVIGEVIMASHNAKLSLATVVAEAMGGVGTGTSRSANFG